MKKKSVPNTLADFKSTHDPSTRFADKIREGLKSLAAEGPEAWENEGKFMRRCGIAATCMPDLREQFRGHWVEVPRISGSQVKRAWFGNAKVAAKARG
jgi:hypothetical protein